MSKQYILVLKKLAFLIALSYAGCIGVSLALAIFISALGGTLIPLLFKKIKIDPAVASGPLITTINDLVSATIYYTLANVFLIGIMGIVG